MAKNNFVSHFLPFQINATIFIFVKFLYKMAACAAILECPKMTFGRISDHFRSIRNFFLNFFLQNGRRRPFWIRCPKFTFDHISGHFRSICNFVFFWKFLTKWLPLAILDVRNSLWITFPAILDQCRFLIFFLNFFTKWLPAAILDVRKSLRSHFWPFQIDTQLYFFWNFWQNGWRWPFWMSEIHFRSHFWPFQIDKQLFFLRFLTKWLTSAILDVRN